MIDMARLEEVIAEAGRIAVGCWPGAGHTPEVWKKAPRDPVSAGDLAVNAFLKCELCALLPEAGWLSEESADTPARLASGLVWVVDPIDGTRDYIRGRNGWAISVALVSGGDPLLGYLCAPARGELWRGEAGRGSWRNGMPLQASTRRQLAGARVPARVLSRADADLVPVEQPNSIALRMAMVAANDADLVATMRWGYEWDLAAAGLIAREAGAVVTDVFGAPIRYNKPDPRIFGVLVASPLVHAAAARRLASPARNAAAGVG
jgi:myo-inositol-1(or 4)-monophosphatase